MQRRFSTVVLIRACLLVWAAAPAYAEAQLPWRFWDFADGLPELTTSWIEPDSKGGAWARHGVSAVTHLDGYSVSIVADRKAGGRLATAPDGSFWVRRGNILRRYDGSKWQSFVVPGLRADAPGIGRTSDTNGFVPLTGKRALILLPERIIQFDGRSGMVHEFRTAARGSLKTFASIRCGRAGTIWVTGRSGLARISETAGEEALHWQEFPAPRGIENLTEPHEGDNGEVLVAAVRSGKAVVARFDGKKWAVLYTGRRDRVQAWRGSDGDTWVADGNQVLRLSKDGGEPVARTEALAGMVQNSSRLADGSFWVATTQGIARYAPPLWRSDAAVRDSELDELVNAFCEDRKGAIWFLSSRYLIRFDGRRWDRFRLPRDFKPEATVTEALSLLPGGDLALAGSTPRLVIFHPATSVFESIPHPEGRTIRMFGRKGGGLLVETLNGTERDGFRLETFDGHTFKTWLDLDKSAGMWDVRAMLETTRGELWIGSVDGLGIVRKGKFRRVSKREGFGMDGVFALKEPTPGRILVGGRRELQEFDGSRWTALASGLDRVRAISVGADRTIWIASGGGVLRRTNGGWLVNDAADGLPSPVAYNVLVDSRGRVWAGTMRGLSQFHREADPDPPHTFIREELNSHSIAPNERARIVFSGIDKWKLTEASRLLFSWRLDGGSWTAFSSAGAAVYPGLRAGKHSFKVRSMDRNGNIDPAAAAFEFAVLAPWYRQPGFLFLMALGLTVIAYLSRSAWRHHRAVAFDSRHDPLTRLFNRRAFEAEMDRAIREAQDDGAEVALLLLDLDRFKPINDTLGHATGDRFLQEIAARMAGCVSHNDVLARVGGDEFAIVVRGDRIRSAAEGVAKRILETLVPPCRIGKHELGSSVSIGVSVFPEDASTAEDLMKAADVAMYHCKSHAKGSFRFFETSMNRMDLSNARLADLISESLQHGCFALHYQPVVTPAGECIAVEALVRMEHATAGEVMPGGFISIAENTGLIVPLGEWVIDDACRQLAVWREAGSHHLRVSVNVSAIQLRQAGFATMVAGILARHKLPASSLILEIRESALMTNRQQACEQLRELRAAGVSIALDDFGTGYSSLNLLHLLPVDIVKMDRSFTEVLGSDPRGEAVLTAITRLAHRLGFVVIAKGVEADHQKTALVKARCDLLQGYLWGHPAPPDMMQEILRGSVREHSGELTILARNLEDYLQKKNGDPVSLELSGIAAHK